MVYENNEAVFEVVDATAIEAAQQVGVQQKKNHIIDIKVIFGRFFSP